MSKKRSVGLDDGERGEILEGKRAGNHNGRRAVYGYGSFPTQHSPQALPRLQAVLCRCR